MFVLSLSFVAFQMFILSLSPLCSIILQPFLAILTTARLNDETIAL